MAVIAEALDWRTEKTFLASQVVNINARINTEKVTGFTLDDEFMYLLTDDTPGNPTKAPKIEALKMFDDDDEPMVGQEKTDFVEQETSGKDIKQIQVIDNTLVYLYE